MAALKEYEEAGWAVMETTEGGVVASGARPEITQLRVFMCSEQQREIMRQFPHISDVIAIDGTFSVGNAGVSTMALVGHLPEAGGRAVPLAFLFYLEKGAAEDAKSLTSTITWFLRQGLECLPPIPLPQLMLHDKCSSTVAALAAVAHEELSSSAALQARAKLYKCLAEGAAQCTPSMLAAAKYVLSCIASDSAPLGKPERAGAGAGAGAGGSGAVDAASSAAARSTGSVGGGGNGAVSAASSGGAATGQALAAFLASLNAAAAAAADVCTAFHSMRSCVESPSSGSGPGGGNAGAAAARAAGAAAAALAADSILSAAAATAAATPPPTSGLFPSAALLLELFPPSAPSLDTSAPSPCPSACPFGLLKECVLESLGHLAPAFYALLLCDMVASEANRLSVVGKPFAFVQDAHDPLFVHSAVFDKVGDAGAFLVKYCLHTSALCWYHGKSSKLKYAKQGTCGLDVSDRGQAVEDFYGTVISVADSREHALILFEHYKARWEKRAKGPWFTYLVDNWLCTSWCSLLLLSKRDRCARLLMVTSNSAENLWSQVKVNWLRGKRLHDFALLCTLLVGHPRNREAIDLCLFGKVYASIRDVLSGLSSRAARRAPFALCAAVEALAQSVAAGMVTAEKVEQGGKSGGGLRFTSKQPVVFFPRAEVGKYSRGSAVSNKEDYIKQQFYPPRSETAITAAILQAEQVAAAHASASSPSGAQFQGSEVPAESLTGALLQEAADTNSRTAQHHALSLSSRYRVYERYVHPLVSLALLDVVLFRSSAGTLRQGKGRGFVGQP